MVHLAISVTGLLFDVTHHYPNSFYHEGGVTMLGALIMIPFTIYPGLSIKPNQKC